MIPSQPFRNAFLLFSVFCTGMAVLIVEIIATRILAPYFGNTIYTTSSVIGTILAALSAGYFFGGKLSDRYPYRQFFYGIVTISGILVLLVYFLDAYILPTFSLFLPITSGPLITSILLFFIPAAFMGLLSPFAIKLYASQTDGIGQRSGEIFFWSTLGSIVGSLLSGFFLIPFFGVHTILIGTGIAVMLIGCIGFFDRTTLPQSLFLVAFFPCLAVVLFLWAKTQTHPTPIVYQTDGIYERIQITDGSWNGQPTRFLFQDKSYSAAMYLHSSDLVYDYSKYYKLYTLENPNASTALVIGGGAYSIPKALLANAPNMHVDVAEIEPELLGLAKQYFNLKDDSRLTNYTQDGRRLLAQSNKTYDVIVSDAYYSFFSIPIHLTTKEFFSLVKSRLNQNGMFIGNFAGDLNPATPSFILSQMHTFREAFPNSYFFAVSSRDLTTPQNIIFVGINNSVPLNFSSPQITQNTDPVIANLGQKNILLARYDLANYPIFTDDYAPVEYYISKSINRWQTE